MFLAQKIANSFRMVRRYQVLGWTFSRYGILGSLSALGLEFGKRGVRWLDPKKITPTDYDSVFGKSLARTFQELGPTFIKLGQVLASRPDLVADYLIPLRQHKVPSMH